MSHGRLVLICGTRPDFIKTGPIAGELRRLGAPLNVINTGQHTTLLEGNPASKDLGGALSLGLPGHPDPLLYVTRATAALVDALDDMKPVACVIVQGDVGTALAGARAAKALNLPLAHVEAGLRSGCLTDPWPEEGFRREITGLADWHYAPTPRAVQNLVDENVKRSTIHLTGNTVVSALARYCPNPIPTDSGIIITLHRRELLRRGQDYLQCIVTAVVESSRRHGDQHFRWPMHPSMRQALGLSPSFAWPRNVVVTDPWDYTETIYRLAGADGLITDSGGLAEEATTLGTPHVVLRKFTDRPESTGLRLDPTPAALRVAFDYLALGHARTPSSAFGSPNAAPLIASHLASLT